MKKFIAGLALSLLCASAFAAGPPPEKQSSKPGFCKSVQERGCGWFNGADFEEEQRKEEEKTAEQPEIPVVGPIDPQKHDKTQLCKARTTWTADCGWVDPGKDWAFMKMQEENLAQQALLNSTSAWSVKQYQLFTRWALDRVSEAAAMWGFNLTQDQDLNPNLRRTTSQMGLRWASEKQKLERRQFFTLVKEDGGFLVYWSRSDCVYCERMQNIVKEVGERSGLEVWNASLDDKCEPKFKDKCLTAPDTIDPAGLLSVKIVPDIMLYMPKEKTWLRIGSGVESADTIYSRMMLYAQSVRAAAISGVKSDIKGQASVDFRRKAEQVWADTGFKKNDTTPPASP